MKIRFETEDDYNDIKALNDLVFKSVVEGNIVDGIRSSCSTIISLVAVEEEKIIGHIFFSPVTVGSGENAITGMALGPMAVLPDFQNKGIGSALINRGIKILKNEKTPFVIVLGHKNYYPRFGFEVASKYDIYPEWKGIPDDAFMILFINKNIADKVSGEVRYRYEFNQAM